MTLAEFRLLYPEFATEADSRVQMYLDEAVGRMEVCRWGCWYEKGLGLYAAHSLAVANANAAANAGAGAGGVAAVASANDWTSKQVGDVQVTKDTGIAAKLVANPMLRSTYGQEWVYYRDLAGTGAVAV